MSRPCRAGATRSAPRSRRLTGIGKRFPGVVANHDVDVDRPPGTVHALVGENGAGKSTLMKILYGVQKPDEGTIGSSATEVSLSSPTDAIEHGVGMVFQHFMLADNLTVLENIVLGAEKLHGIGDGRARRDRRASPTPTGSGSSPTCWSRSLGVGARQRVEIPKVLYRGARIIILDEPTAVLVPQEVDALFDNLRELKDEGNSRAVHLPQARRGAGHRRRHHRHAPRHHGRHGRSGRRHRAPARRADGRRRAAVARARRSPPSPTTCSCGRATSRSPTSSAAPLLSDISLSIHARRGARHRRRRGQRPDRARRDDHGHAHPRPARAARRRDVTRWHTRKLRESGIGYIPEDRQRHGLLLDAPLWENRVLGHQTRAAERQGPLDQPAGARKDTERIVEQYDVRTPGIDVAGPGAVRRQPAEAHRRPRDERRPDAARRRPTPPAASTSAPRPRSGTTSSEARRDGLAVLLISADLDELIGLSDTHPGDPARAHRRRVRPADGHAAAARRGDDRSGRGRQ